jgi:hypothetical protein
MATQNIMTHNVLQQDCIHIKEAAELLSPTPGLAGCARCDQDGLPGETLWDPFGPLGSCCAYGFGDV